MSTAAVDSWEKRSRLRKWEAWLRKNPLADAHVKTYIRATSAWQRRIVECMFCHEAVRRLDWLRDRSGHLYNHCGCRAGRKSGRQKCALGTKAERQRLARLRGAGKYKAPRFDAHVKAWQKKTVASKPALHDAHVKCFKRNAARMARWKTANVPAYRLHQRMRVAIRKALKRGKSGRRWEDMIGYRVSDLADHLARTLPRRWTLERALSAGWHIDHIVPKSSFRVDQDADELRACWSLSNLRLVPAQVNLKKQAKRLTLV